MKFKDSDVSIHPSVDNSDPGFAVKGIKLRWLSGAVEARRSGRIWQPLTKSMLPEATRKKLEAVQPAFKNGEDTIRRRDLTLAFAPNHLVEEKRRELKAQQNANEAVFRPGSTQGLPEGAKTDRSTGITRQAVETSDRY